MESQTFHYQFHEALDIAEVEATYNLSLLSTATLHGESRVRLETHHQFDATRRTCVIEANGEVGMDLNRLFFGFILREFGAESFRVERLDAFDAAPVTART